MRNSPLNIGAIMSEQIEHFVLCTEPVVKPIYERCVIFPEEWEVSPDLLVIHVVNNLNISDPANAETIVHLYMHKFYQRLLQKGMKIPDDKDVSVISQMIIQLILCLMQQYQLFGLWHKYAHKLRFHNFVGYDIILATG